jgi:Ca2+/H+ antiporter
MAILTWYYPRRYIESTGCVEMLVDINADLSKKVQAIADLSGQTFDRVVNALLSNAVESILPIQALRLGHKRVPSATICPGAAS